MFYLVIKLNFLNANGNQIMEGAVIEKGHLDDVLPHSGLMGRKENQSPQIVVLMFLPLSAYYIIQLLGWMAF